MIPVRGLSFVGVLVAALVVVTLSLSAAADAKPAHANNPVREFVRGLPPNLRRGLQQAPRHLGQSEACTICEAVVTALDNAIQANATMDVIEALAVDICIALRLKDVPASVCASIIPEYAVEV